MDLQRRRRLGMVEAVWGEHKTAAQIATILKTMHHAGELAFVTRVDPVKAADVQARCPEVQVHAAASCLTLGKLPPGDGKPLVAVLSGGTSDRRVAEEAALAAEAAGVAAFKLIGLEVSWPALERVYGTYKLPPALPAHASRDGQGLFDRGGRQVGYITSSTWSPVLKKYIAIGTVESAYAEGGQVLQLEHMVEYRRHRVEAQVVERPFFDPPRKRSVPSKGNHG